MTIYCGNIYCQKPYPKRADKFYRSIDPKFTNYLARCAGHIEPMIDMNGEIYIEISENEYLAAEVLES